ncbi:MAG: WD40 repeat domain-containing protein [Nitrospirae bacterium]|nr:WD40 repeat domain-containing protein [Nitrospirota bacterium]
MTPIATIPLHQGDALSIPFKVHCSADGKRLAILNTFGLPYAQQLIVVDTETHREVGRWAFPPVGRHLFNLDMQLTPDGAACVLVGGVLTDPFGQSYEDDCTLTRLDLATGERRRLKVGPVGYNFVSVAPDGRTAYVIVNGNSEDPVQHYQLFVVDLDAMAVLEARTLDAPINNILYRPAEGRALVSLGRDVVSLDLASHAFGEKLCPRFNHPYLLAAFAPDEDLVYAAYVASKVVVKTIDVRRRSVVAQHDFSWGWTASTNIVPFGPDHLIFPPSSSAGAICLWNRRTGAIDHQAGLEDHLILSAPHPDGERFYLFDYRDRAMKLVAAAPLFARGRERAR